MVFLKEKPRILFVYSSLSPFVRGDMKILERHFNVENLKVITFLIPRKGRSPSVFLTLLKHVLWSDVVYSWWADLNAFFIVLFCMLSRKKSVIVVGGYEAAYVPEVNYGTLLSLSGRLKVKFILRHASKVLAVSSSSAKQITSFVRTKNLQIVYNFVDTEAFKPAGSKENLVITTVGEISSDTIKIKRLDAFVKVATYLPDITFILIGKSTDVSAEDLKKLSGSNVKFTGYLSYEELLQYYQRAKVYCQLSTVESFGVALAEAMSCGCVPVVTRRYSIPEVVGETGFYAPYNDPKATADVIRKALKSDKSSKARERIQKYFSLEIREKRLIEEVSNLIRNSS